MQRKQWDWLSWSYKEVLQRQQQQPTSAKGEAPVQVQLLDYLQRSPAARALLGLAPDAKEATKDQAKPKTAEEVAVPGLDEEGDHDMDAETVAEEVLVLDEGQEEPLDRQELQQVYDATARLLGHESQAALAIAKQLGEARAQHQAKKPVQLQMVEAARKVQQLQGKLDKTQSRVHTTSQALGKALEALREAEEACTAAQEKLDEAKANQSAIMAKTGPSEGTTVPSAWKGLLEFQSELQQYAGAMEQDNVWQKVAAKFNEIQASLGAQLGLPKVLEPPQPGAEAKPGATDQKQPGGAAKDASEGEPRQASGAPAANGKRAGRSRSPHFYREEDNEGLQQG